VRCLVPSGGLLTKDGTQEARISNFQNIQSAKKASVAFSELEERRSNFDFGLVNQGF